MSHSLPTALRPYSLAAREPSPDPSSNRDPGAAAATVAPDHSAAALANSMDELVYRCPGDSMLISHSIHLGRMAASYPPCARCELGEVGSGRGPAVLVGRRLSGPGAVAPEFRSQPVESPFTIEGFEGVVDNQIHPAIVRKLALAAGIEWMAAGGETSQSASERPTVVIAADGRAIAAELLSAAAEGLRLSGCDIIELGPLTAPDVAQSITEFAADGGLFIGNPQAASHTVGMRLWSRGARPMSSPGRLDAVRARLETTLARPTRVGGRFERRAAAPQRQARLQELFHGLRPLRFVLDASSRPFANQLSRLLARTACRGIAPRPALGEPAARAAGMLGGRLASLAAATLAEQADFGLWVDGDGERLQLVDEQGRRASIERVVAALACDSPATTPGHPPLVGEEPFEPRTRAALEARGFVLALAPARREPFAEAMVRCGASLGGGASGRLWFSDSVGAPAPDALEALGRLLRLLSRGDAPLSTALDAVEPRGSWD